MCYKYFGLLKLQKMRKLSPIGLHASGQLAGRQPKTCSRLAHHSELVTMFENDFLEEGLPENSRQRYGKTCKNPEYL
jgi:hypothetical protein